MIRTERCIVVDIDGTLCPIKKDGERYDELMPYPEVVQRLHEYRQEGFYIILATSRNMQTYGGNLGVINAKTSRKVLAWLDRHGIPYDEIHFGKPWSGNGGFYVDDKAVRPSEFVSLPYDEILRLISNG